MTKEFDLIKWIVIASIIAVTLILCGITLADADFSSVMSDMNKPLEFKNWHFALIVILLLNRK